MSDVRPSEAPTQPPVTGTGEDRIPAAFGEYEVLGEIARGGMGTVYRARQAATGRVVALKVIRADRLADLGADDRRRWVQRFRWEAEAVARLDHPHIVPLYQAGEWDDRPYFSMKLVNGNGLESHSGRLREDPAGAARLIASVARAIHHAHQHQILHRDLKPQNILIDAEGQPFVTDFGLARRTEGAPSGLSDPGTIVGTPEYMAPEQVRAEPILTTAVDVYGLGAVLYELLTGKPPFRGKTPLDTLLEVLDRDPVAPRKLNPLVDPDLEAICLACVAKDPAHRYESAAAVAEDLDRWLRGEPITRRPLSARERTWRWCRRNPLPAALAAGMAGLALILTLVAVLAAVHFGRLAEHEHQVAASERVLREQATTAEQKATAERDAKDRALTRAEGMRLLAQAEVVRPTNPGLALLLAIEAATRHDGLVVNNALLACLEACREERTLLGHQAAVTDARFSPDGRRALTGSADRTASLWDVAAGTKLFALDHPSGVATARYSPDGRRVLTITRDRMARVWDVETGKRVSLLEASKPDGMKEPEEDGSTPPNLHEAGAFAPDGRRVVTAFGVPRVWDADTGKELFTLTGHTGWAGCAVFSPDGKTILSGSEDKTARLWDAATGRPLAVLRGHENPVVFARFSPDGSRILTLGENRLSDEGNPTPMKEEGFGRIWDARTGKQTAALVWPKGWIGTPRQGVFSPDGSQIVTADLQSYSSLHNGAHSVISSISTYDDRRMGGPSLWEASSGRYLQTLRLADPWDRALSAAFTPAGRFIAASATDGVARLWDAATGRELAPLRGHRGPVPSVALSPDGRRALTSGEDGTARVWEVAFDAEAVRRKGRWFGVQIAISSPDGKFLVTSPPPGEKDSPAVCLWDVASNTERLRFEGHRSKVQLVRFAPDGTRLVTCGMDNTTRVWEVATGKLLHTIRSQGINQLAEFSPNGQLLLTGDRGVGLVHEVATGQVRARLEGDKEKGFVLSARFTPDSRRVVSTNYRESYADGEAVLTQRDLGTEALSMRACNRVRVWDVATGKELRNLQPSQEGMRLFGAPLIRPDGAEASVTTYPSHLGATNHGLVAWDLTTAVERAAFDGHTDLIMLARYSPDGRYLITASRDKTARLWDSRTGRPLAVFRGHTAALECAGFSQDGERVVTAGRDRTARLWSVQTGKEQATLIHDAVVFTASFTGDGARVLTLAEDGEARLWPIDLLSAARGRRPRDPTAEEREAFEIGALER